VLGAIRAAISTGGSDDWIFSMPDTYTDNPLFPEELTDPLELGLFKTENSERFGMLRGTHNNDDIRIVDKEEGPPGKAWGAFMFNKDVAKLFMNNAYGDHTEALNAAIREFNWGSWPMEIYRDIASFRDYLELLGDLYAEKHSTV